MILLLVHWLSSQYGIHIPAVFGYISTRMVLSAATALIVSIAFGPLLIGVLRALKLGQPIRSTLGDLHKDKHNTPTMGGVLILLAMFISMVLWMDLTEKTTHLLLGTTLWLGLVGGVDDFLKLKFKSSNGLPGKLKFLCQALFAVTLAIYFLSSPTYSSYITDLYIPFFKHPLFTFGGTVFVLYVIFIVAGTSNAVNLTDGLDGLAVGSLILVASTLAYIAFLSSNHDLANYLNILHLPGSSEIAVYLCGVVGACLGFLWYNGHPAQVFMGDTGSLALGGVLGVSSLLLARTVLLGVIGGIFVIEALSVIIQVGSYKLRQKRVFLCTPIHHHFEYLGWPESKIVLRFWIVGLLLSLVGLASLKFQ